MPADEDPWASFYGDAETTEAVRQGIKKDRKQQKTAGEQEDAAEATEEAENAERNAAKTQQRTLETQGEAARATLKTQKKERGFLRRIKDGARTTKQVFKTGHSIIGSIIKYIIITAIVLFIVILLLYAAFVNFEEDCRHYRQTPDPGWPAFQEYTGGFWPPWSMSNYTSCIMSEPFSAIIYLVQQVSITKRALDFLDTEISRATGDTYFQKIEQNEREPTGVFIENIDAGKSYYTDEPLSTTADIKVKTIGNMVVGSTECDINSVPSRTMHPHDGVFKTDKSTTFSIGCFYPQGTLPPGDGTLRFTVVFDFDAFAYVIPTFVKYEVYKKLSDTQKSQLERKAQDVLLRTTNTPVKIGGAIGDEEDKVVVVNNMMIVDNKIKNLRLAIKFIVENWDEGKIKRVRKLAIALPTGLELDPDIDDPAAGIVACGGYRFHQAECTNGKVREYLNEGLIGDQEKEAVAFCKEDGRENLYLLDVSGDNKKIQDVTKSELLSCWLDADYNTVFDVPEDGDIGVNVLPIKVLTSYDFSITRSKRIKLMEKPGADFQLIARTCNDDVYEIASSAVSSIPDSAMRTYANKFQSFARKYSTSKYLTSGLTAPEMEALIAAVIQRYTGIGADASSSSDPASANNNDIDGNNIYDFITGCRYTTPSQAELYRLRSEDFDGDVRCFVEKIRVALINTTNDINTSLESYYKDGSIAGHYLPQFTSSRRAGYSDFSAWLKAICKEK